MADRRPSDKPPSPQAFEGTLDLSEFVRTLAPATPFVPAADPAPEIKAKVPHAFEGTLDLSIVMQELAPALPFTSPKPARPSAATLEEKFSGTVELTDAEIEIQPDSEAPRAPDPPATQRFDETIQLTGAEIPRGKTPFPVAAAGAPASAQAAAIPGAPWADAPSAPAPSSRGDLESTLSLEPARVPVPPPALVPLPPPEVVVVVTPIPVEPVIEAVVVPIVVVPIVVAPAEPEKPAWSWAEVPPDPALAEPAKPRVNVQPDLGAGLYSKFKKKERG